jgi:hypothetical protein
VFETRALRRIFGSKRIEWLEVWENCITKSSDNLCLSQDTHDTQHEWRRGMHVRYWCESQMEKRPLWRPNRRWVNNIKMVLKI